MITFLLYFIIYGYSLIPFLFQAYASQIFDIPIIRGGYLLGFYKTKLILTPPYNKTIPS
jgi:hypothetical protein